MTKNEFLTQFAAELTKRGVADRDDVLEEYRQHFDFKMADGYTQEEIAAKLGTPASLAAQFEPTQTAPKPALAIAGLCFVDLFAGLGFIALAAFGLVLAAAAVGFAAVGVCLLVKRSLFGLIPAMPYASAALMGLALLALGLLTGCGFWWYAAFWKQTLRAFQRFHSNTLATAKGLAALPALPLAPQMDKRKARALRKTARVCVILFALLFVTALAVSMILAGGFAFWHIWGWFGYR